MSSGHKRIRAMPMTVGDYSFFHLLFHLLFIAKKVLTFHVYRIIINHIYFIQARINPLPRIRPV